MTPEVAHSVATRARALRASLAPSADPIAAATAARRLFEEAEDEVRVRWLNLELHGYQPALSAIGPLPRVLRVPPHDRLAAHVAAYRTQRGMRHGSPDFVHFFVEALPELVAARQQASSAAGSEFALSFGPDPRSSECDKATLNRRREVKADEKVRWTAAPEELVILKGFFGPNPSRSITSLGPTRTPRPAACCTNRGGARRGDWSGASSRVRWLDEPARGRASRTHR